MKTTKWIQGAEPVRAGVYQRKYVFGIDYAYFDGKDWGLACETVEGASRWGSQIAFRTSSGLPWRGLTKESK